MTAAEMTAASFTVAKFGLPVKGSFPSRKIENTKQRGGGDKTFCLAPAFIFSARWQDPPLTHNACVGASLGRR